MLFVANPSYQNVLHLAKKNQFFEPNSSVLCEPVEIVIFTRHRSSSIWLKLAKIKV